MSIPALAFFHRALRQDVRLLRPHLARFFFAGFLFAAMVSAHLTSSLFGAPGLQFFTSIVELNFALITLATVGYFSTAITEEKEEQTLGLLRLAGVGTATLLLGKSTSRTVIVGLMLAVQLPFTLLAITLGGVGANQIVAAYVALVAYILFGANLGLLGSVLCRTSASAMALTILALAVVLGLPRVSQLGFGVLVSAEWLATAGPVVQTARPVLDFLNEVSVWTRLERILATGFAEPAVSAQVIFHLAAAAGCFFVSWAGFDYFTREGDSRLRLLLRRWLRPGRLPRRRPSRRVWEHALIWKEFQFGVGGLRWLAVRLAVCLALAGLIVSSLHPKDVGVSLTAAMVALLTIEAGVQASRIFREEIQYRTLGALTMLPRTTGQMARAKVAGRLPGLIPAFAVLMVGAAVSPDGAAEFQREYLPGRLGWLLVVQFLVFLYVTARLSLSVRWGALPLALAIVYVLLPAVAVVFLLPLLTFWPAMLMPGRGTAVIWIWEILFVPLDVVGFAAIALLQVSIIRKLAAVAGD